uniref:NADH-quinone oxidoreductase subunit A n=1 Tax=Fervidicoccus fontis TaxID=683846 RepID=A0A7J3ZLW4_9CREN
MLLEVIAAFGILPVFLLLLLIGVILLLYYINKPVPEESKFERFESGHVTRDPARVGLGFQYFGFLVIFATLEPIIVFLLLVASTSVSTFLDQVAIVLIAIAIVIPVLAFALRESKDVKPWSWR